MSHTFFFEILLEEIPAWMLPSRIAALRSGAAALVEEFSGTAPSAETVRAGATSRRLWISLEQLPGRQADREDEVKGPSGKAAYAADGSLTRALEGFLRKNQAAPEDVTVRDDYVWLKRKIAGQKIEEVLQRKIPPLIESLQWPKTMRWGRGERSYIRPVHSVISLFDGELLPMTVLEVEAGTRTTGHRILAPGPIEVSEFDDYRRKLSAAHVVVDAEERVERLRKEAARLAEEAGGKPAEDESIWDQWKFLTEAPGVVRAEFDERFLSLPYEVLVTVMRVHQKQLPIWAGDRLTSSYLAVMDQIGDPDRNVATGNAFVTNARFADAGFFHEADRRRPLEERVPELARLQFQEKLGNYLDKTGRVVSIARSIGDRAPGADVGAIERAARLCKADLVTEMVKEFTELQGKIGGIYAREEGEPDAIWQAIYDHYSPLNVEDDVPRTLSGAAVALADRLDTLAGFFSIGLKPSGSKDPFALRRAAQSAVQILLVREPWKIELPLDALIDLALAAHELRGDGARKVHEEIREFFADRVRTLMEHPRYGAFFYDEIAAGMASGWSGSLTDLQDRLGALRAARSSPAFLSILDSAKRIRNIAGGESTSAVEERLLEHPVEKRLSQLSEMVGEQIDELVAARQYGAALESFAGMAPELETFFDEVLVMVDDVEVRRNRIALLNRVGQAARKIADVTKIVVDRRDYNPQS